MVRALSLGRIAHTYVVLLAINSVSSGETSERHESDGYTGRGPWLA